MKLLPNTGHNAMDPEYSILKHRLEQHMIRSGFGHKGITLDTLTKIAEQAITSVSSPAAPPFPGTKAMRSFLHILGFSSKRLLTCDFFVLQDLEKLIMETVDESKADYAVITGIQIHNWSDSFTDLGEPSLEFIQPCKAYTVVHGRRTEMDIQSLPVR